MNKKSKKLVGSSLPKVLTKKPKFYCKFCGEKAVFDLRDETTGKALGLMCERCCFNYFEFASQLLQ